MLRDDIAAALKKAMIEKDKLRLSTLRLVNAAIQDLDIARRGENKPKAADDDVQALLVKMVKQRDDAVKLYEQGNRPDLAEAEKNEVAIIREFLPRQLDSSEMQAIITTVIAATGAESLRDMGRVVAQLKEQYMGQMDFTVASAIIKEQLQ